MKLVVITNARVLPGEEVYYSHLMDLGVVDSLHLYKPCYNFKETRELLLSIPDNLHQNIVVHDHFELLNEFNLKGIHISRKQTYLFPKFKKDQYHISISCHSFYDLYKLGQDYDYVFLGPVFKGLEKESKEGFTITSLKEYFAKKKPVTPIIALGGITTSNMEQLRDIGFSGMAFKDWIWDSEFYQNPGQKLIIKKLKELHLKLQAWE